MGCDAHVQSLSQARTSSIQRGSNAIQKVMKMMMMSQMFEGGKVEDVFSDMFSDMFSDTSFEYNEDDESNNSED